MSAGLRAGYKQTEVGVIPEDWDVRTLLDLAERKKELFDDGDWIESEHITTAGVRLIQTGNIGVGNFIEKAIKKFIYAESFTVLRCKQLKIGDLLVSRLADPAGRACVLPDIGEERIVTSIDVTIFRPPSEVVDRTFLMNVFSTPEWFRAISDRSGGTTHKRISRGALGRISIQIPPLPEQRAIAAALSDVDALLGGLDRLIAKKQGLKVAAMQQLLTGQTRLPGFSGEWEVKRLGNVSPLQRGFDLLTSRLRPGPYPVVYSNGVSSYHHEFMVKGPGVVTGRSGTIGNVHFVNDDYWPHNTSLWVTSFRGNSPMFVYYLLGSLGLDRFSTGSGVPTLNRNDVHDHRVLVPPIVTEQTAIATILSDMDTELAALQARRGKTLALKQAMMQELLTGRIRLV